MRRIIKNRWTAAYAALFVLGLVAGKVTSGNLPSPVSQAHGAVATVLAFQLDHLALLAGLALLVLLALIAKRRATGREGLIVYFGVGLCIARLIFEVHR
jgi:hypothetical protein